MSTLNTESSERISIKNVLEEMIRTSDLNYVTAVPREKFERLLAEEVENVGAFPKQDHDRVREHIHEHLRELYDYAMHLSLAAMVRHAEDTLVKVKRLLDDHQASISETSKKSKSDW
jgi:hypothetical protein